MRLNKDTRKKVEQIFKEIGYDVRYEKGNFTSGSCIVHEKNLVVVNKFLDTEGRISTLMEIFLELDEVDENALSEGSKDLIKKYEKDRARWLASSNQ